MDTFFTREHEWVAVSGDTATVGITDYAQAQIGDIVFVEVPPEGARVTKGHPAALVESVKAASDILSPVSGRVIESNPRLKDEPSLLNAAPETDGWLFRVALADSSELTGLFDAEAYRARVKRL